MSVKASDRIVLEAFLNAAGIPAHGIMRVFPDAQTAMTAIMHILEISDQRTQSATFKPRTLSQWIYDAAGDVGTATAFGRVVRPLIGERVDLEVLWRTPVPVKALSHGPVNLEKTTVRKLESVKSLERRKTILRGAAPEEKYLCEQFLEAMAIPETELEPYKQMRLLPLLKQFCNAISPPQRHAALSGRPAIAAAMGIKPKLLTTRLEGGGQITTEFITALADALKKISAQRSSSPEPDGKWTGRNNGGGQGREV